MKVRQLRAGHCLWRGCFWELHGQYVGNQLNRRPREAVGRFPSSSPRRCGHKPSGEVGEWFGQVEAQGAQLVDGALSAAVLLFFVVRSLAGVFLWRYGAPMVMPFAWVEVLAVSVAVLAYAAPRGRWRAIRLASRPADGRVAWGSQLQRVERVSAAVASEHDLKLK